MRFNVTSRRTAGGEFQSAAMPTASLLRSVAVSSTDASRIGSAGGVSMFDSVLTGVLEGMRGVMDQLAAGLEEGLDAEGQLMTDTASAYELTEEANTIDSGMIGLGGV